MKQATAFDPVWQQAADAISSRMLYGEPDADPLLPAEDRADVERGAAFDQRIARIGGKEIGALAAEDFCDDVGAVHGVSFVG